VERVEGEAEPLAPMREQPEAVVTLVADPQELERLTHREREDGLRDFDRAVGAEEAAGTGEEVFRFRGEFRKERVAVADPRVVEDAGDRDAGGKPVSDHVVEKSQGEAAGNGDEDEDFGKSRRQAEAPVKPLR
jgi:hypothetical protein